MALLLLIFTKTRIPSMKPFHSVFIVDCRFVQHTLHWGLIKNKRHEPHTVHWTGNALKHKIILPEICGKNGKFDYAIFPSINPKFVTRNNRSGTQNQPYANTLVWTAKLLIGYFRTHIKILNFSIVTALHCPGV